MNSPVLYVVVGGALGSALRYWIQGAALARLNSLPLGTVVVNVGGAFLMGFVMTAFQERFVLQPAWRFFIATGFLGGLTTFSGLAWDAYQLLTPQSSTALVYLGGSLIGGGLALWAGIALGRWV